MPKVRRFACDYRGRQMDISFWVLKKMKLNHMNQSDVAKILGITQQKVSDKLNPDVDRWFSLLDLMRLVDEFQATDSEVVKLIKV